MHPMQPTITGGLAMLESVCWPDVFGNWTIAIAGALVWLLYQWFAYEVRVIWKQRDREWEWLFWGALIIVFHVCSWSYLLSSLGVWVVPTQDLMAIQHAVLVPCTLTLCIGSRALRGRLVGQHSAEEIRLVVEGVDDPRPDLAPIFQTFADRWVADRLNDGESSIGVVECDMEGRMLNLTGAVSAHRFRGQFFGLGADDPDLLQKVWPAALERPTPYRTTWRGVEIHGIARPRYDATGREVVGFIVEYIALGDTMQATYDEIDELDSGMGVA